MSIFQKRQLAILSLTALVLCLVVFGAKFIKESPLEGHSKAFQVEFDKLSSQSKNTLDLRSFRPALWDEAIVWGAYVDICSLRITGYSAEDSSCRSISEDGGCRLLFLKDNSLVAEVDLDRRKMDLCTSDLPERLKRNQFLLKAIGEEEFPKVSLVP